ncbi:MAG: biopolymer transporter ExbD [Myxococcota bacterium]
MAGGGGEGGELDIGINLTALLDVLTNLLFFLLFGFAAQRAEMDLDRGVTLPVSSADTPTQNAIEVTIARDELRVEKRTIAPITGGRAVTAAGRIEPLYKELSRLKRLNAPETLESPGVALIVCDKDTRYDLLKTVLMTAAQAGFAKYRLAVLME